MFIQDSSPFGSYGSRSVDVHIFHIAPTLSRTVGLIFAKHTKNTGAKSRKHFFSWKIYQSIYKYKESSFIDLQILSLSFQIVDTEEFDSFSSRTITNSRKSTCSVTVDREENLTGKKRMPKNSFSKRI